MSSAAPTPALFTPALLSEYVSTPTATATAFKDIRRQPRGGMRPVVKSDANTQTDLDTVPEEKNDDEPNENNRCSICLDERNPKELKTQTNITITSCGHVFCTSCLLKHLIVRNTCPNCRAEIEPARKPFIEPLTADTVATIIRDEETAIDMGRRIAVIGVFPDSEGRAAMIMSLARELAFGAAHSMAGWQGTDDTTYHASWNEFEYNNPEDNDDDDDDDDSDVDDSDVDDSDVDDSEHGDQDANANGTNGENQNGHGDCENENDNEGRECGDADYVDYHVDGPAQRRYQMRAGDAELESAENSSAIISRPLTAPQRRAVFQSPSFQILPFTSASNSNAISAELPIQINVSHSHNHNSNPWLISTFEISVRIIIVLLSLYYEFIML
jgi:hypothetical protein